MVMIAYLCKLNPSKISCCTYVYTVYYIHKDKVTLTALAKSYFTKYFHNTSIASLGEIIPQLKFMYLYGICE